MVRLDWELDYYDFDADECRHGWHDIRMIAVRSELDRFPQARPGDLLVTFPDRLNAAKILSHFDSMTNFRHGFVDVEEGRSVVHVLLAPMEGRRGRSMEPAPSF